MIKGKINECSKDNFYFQSFYINVSVEKIALTLPISFEKRFQYVQMKFHKESFLLIKEKRRGSLDSFVTQARIMGEKASMDVILVFSKLSDIEKNNSFKLEFLL